MGARGRAIDEPDRAGARAGRIDVAPSDHSSRRLALVVKVVVGLVVVALVVGGVALWRRPSGSSAMCAGLGGKVQGLEPVRMANGISAAGPSWLVALTEGQTLASEPSRRQIATAVAADTAGFERMVADLAPADRRSFEVLRDAAIAGVGSAAVTDPEVSASQAHVSRLAVVECNLV